MKLIDKCEKFIDKYDDALIDALLDGPFKGVEDSKLIKNTRISLGITIHPKDKLKTESINLTGSWYNRYWAWGFYIFICFIFSAFLLF